ncbi:phage/plasmid primase, P4 family [Kyrpidia spormannii]|uniref:Phage/plasmid primase, P4 family n=2 Tax=Kyrpidia spormannii TaxID=2055160 RepID=A0ACA8Z888_9BACL|nr:phage/plasmid primase, P4 family [Kyrpidia spormannii]CAB3391655.1 Phage/plasmid primase, P4 family [Kyrpidia spormannii]CAB3392567.1 Phage/plasmid primase, P4 family [Kyrpidia spormannii]
MPYGYSNTSGQDMLRDWLENVLPSPVRWNGAEGRTLCPFHDDHDPSLSVNVEKGVWYCHAGCGSGPLRSLADMMGVESPPLVEFLDEDDGRKERRKGKLKTRRHEVEYVYQDENGNPVLLVGRDGHGRGKKFAQYHWEAGQWRTGKGTAPLVPYRLPVVRLAIAEGKPVFVVEGEKDAGRLTENGLTATTAPMGAGKWPASQEFNRWFKDADIIILPDNDEPGQKHARQVAHSLAPYAKRIRVVELPGLPEKGDVSDWLDAGHTVQELLTLVEQAPEWKPEPGNVVVLGGGRFDLDVRRRYWDGDTFVPLLLAQDVMSRERFVYEGGILYRYKDGVYKPDGEQVAKRWCLDLLGPEHRINRVRETLAIVQTATALEYGREFDPDDGLINLKNGLLRWNTLELLPHTPDRLSRIQLPVEFDVNAECPEIRRFLRDVLPDEEAVWTVLEFAGYCLVPNAKHEKALMLVGPGGGGKSKLIGLITALLGQENTVAIPLQELADNRWKRADLQGKLLNAFADISHKAIENSGVFKAIVSGDSIDAERKHKDPFYFRPFAKLLFSANELPGTRDVSQAYFDRWLVIPMTRRFRGTDKEDKNILQRITRPEELSGLLNLALEALFRLEVIGYPFTVGPASQAALEQYRLDVDSVASFLEERISINPAGVVPKSVLYNAYVMWCEQAGYRPLYSNRFAQRLKALRPTIKEDRAGHNRDRVWYGLNLLPSADAAVDFGDD